MSDSPTSLQALRETALVRWAALAPRERLWLLAAAWLLGLTLLVTVGIRPAVRTLAQAPEQLRTLDAQLDQMRRMADEAQALRQRPPVPPAQAEAALRAATDRLGSQARLSLVGDRATVTLTAAPGPALAAWLDEVRSGARARPVEASLQQAEAGTYSGSIVLTLATAPAPR